MRICRTAPSALRELRLLCCLRCCVSQSRLKTQNTQRSKAKRQVASHKPKKAKKKEQKIRVFNTNSVTLHTQRPSIMTGSVASAAAASSIMSHRSSSASVRSQQQQSERSYSSYIGDVGGGSISSRTSLQDGLDSIKKQSSATYDQNENIDTASNWSNSSASRRSSTTSKPSTTSTAKKLGQIAENSIVASGSAVSVLSQRTSISKTSSLGQASRNSSSTVPISVSVETFIMTTLCGMT